MTAVLAVGPWRTNAELIAHGVVPLGYLAPSMSVLDPTWGLGRWWRLWRPDVLVGSDLDPAKSPGPAADFRSLPYRDGVWDAVAFDPPYKLNGASTARGPAVSDEGYGVAVSYTRWQDRHELIRDGITESVRVLRPGGHLLVKCQDQVSSGAVRWQTREFADHAEAQGCRLVDALHVVGHRRQPSGRRQVHARRNYSTLLVLRRVP